MSGLYDGTIASIPGLGGFVQQNQLNDAQTAKNLGDAATVMQLIKGQKQQQEEDRVREALQSGGTPEQVVQRLVMAGPTGLQAAQHYVAANQALASQKMLQGLDMTNPDALDRAGAALAMSGHPAAGAMTSLAEKMRVRQANVDEHNAQVSQVAPITAMPQTGVQNGVVADRSQIVPGGPMVTGTAGNQQTVEPVPPEVLQAVASGKPFSVGVGPSANPAENAQRTGGLFSQFYNSPISVIRQAAPAQQAALDASNPQSISPQNWQTQASQMQSREGTLASAEAARQQALAIAGMRDTRAAQGQAISAAKAGLTTDGTPSPATALSGDALEAAAARYRLDGTLPPNMGRGAQGAIDTRRILNRAAEMAADSGDTPEAQRLNQLSVKAGSQALGQLTRTEQSIGAFEKNALMNADLALQASEKVDRTGVPVFNRWLQAGRTAIAGDEDARVFNAANETFVSEYAKVMSGGSGASASTEGAQNRAHSLLSTADTPAQYRAVIAQLKMEMANRMQGFAQQKAELMKGMNPNPSSAPAPQSVPTIVNDKGMKLYLNNGKWLPTPP